MKRLLLLGGGHAHVHVLQELARAPLPGCEVMLVTPFARQFYSGMLPGFVAGHYAEDDCAIPLVPLAGRAQVLFVEGEARSLDAAQRTVHLADGRNVPYDLLSIDVGSVIERDVIAGAREHGLFVRPIEHFVRLLPGLVDLAARRPLDIAVIGAGAAGVEIAMALQQRLCVHEGTPARVALVTGGGEPLAGYPQSVRSRVAAALRQRRITVLRESCTSIGGQQLELANGARVACDAPLVMTGGTPPRWLAESGLAFNEAGRVRTGATLQSVSNPEVWAAGDCAARDDAPHPASGVYAVRAGPPLAASLRAAVGGVPLPTYMPQQRSLNLVSCGSKAAIMAWGEWALAGRWVWWWKDRIDRGFIARYRG